MVPSKKKYKEILYKPGDMCVSLYYKNIYSLFIFLKTEETEAGTKIWYYRITKGTLRLDFTYSGSLTMQTSILLSDIDFSDPANKMLVYDELY